MDEINQAGYLAPEAVFIDGTHIKANANLKKAVKKGSTTDVKAYEKQLLTEEINEDRDKRGKNHFDNSKLHDEKELSQSTTDHIS